MGLDGCVESVGRLISHGSIVTSKEGLQERKTLKWLDLIFKIVV